MKVNYTCPNCEHKEVLEVTPPRAGQLSGPPERCYPPEDGDYEPTECSNCAEDFDYDLVMDAVEDYITEQGILASEQADYDDYYDSGRGGN